MKAINATMIYNDIKTMQYASTGNADFSDGKRDEIFRLLPAGTLAYKIMESSTYRNFSEKQLWVIAYELMKNEAYKAALSESYEAAEALEARQKAARKARNSNKSLRRKMNDEIRANLGNAEAIKEITARYKAMMK